MSRKDAKNATNANEKGVTLIELLIVSAIAAAMVSIALPSFTRGLDDFHLSQATNTTAAFLNSGLNRVERRQQVMEFTISPRDNLILLRSLDGTFTAATFKDRSGVGRNLTIHILEYLDKMGPTRRTGDARIVLRGGEVFG